jgi:hypothetical protein
MVGVYGLRFYGSCEKSVAVYCKRTVIGFEERMEYGRVSRLSFAKTELYDGTIIGSIEHYRAGSYASAGTYPLSIYNITLNHWLLGI